MKKSSLSLSPKLSIIVTFIIAASVAVFAVFFRSTFLILLQYIWMLIGKIKNSILWVNNYLALNNDKLLTKVLFAFLFALCVSFPLTFLITYVITKIKLRGVVKRHFHFSYQIIKNRMIPVLYHLISKNSEDEDKTMDCYIQSPLEYVNETLNGNRVPKFEPNILNQSFLFDDSTEYIVAITAENLNLFLDPTIGFYMSNCYAASIIRHTNDFIKDYKSDQETVPYLTVKKSDDLNDIIRTNSKELITLLKNGNKPQNFEFIRFFIFDEHQNNCCKDAVLPSLKASQDLFRTFSFYINKEELSGQTRYDKLSQFQKIIMKLKGVFNCSSTKIPSDNDWDTFQNNNKVLWESLERYCQDNKNALTVLKERIKNVIPEFLFVFYENKTVIHTFLGGERIREDVYDPNMKEKIMELIKILAKYVDKNDNNGQLSLKVPQKNIHDTFIDWVWKNK